MTLAQACNMERLDNNMLTPEPMVVSKSAGTMQVDGWVANIDAKSVPSDIFFRLQSLSSPRLWQLPAKTGVVRDAVAKNLGDPAAFSGAGYTVKVDIGTLPTDSYRLYVAYKDGEALKFCGNGRVIELKD
jgi:hypothetical protein